MAGVPGANQYHCISYERQLRGHLLRGGGGAVYVYHCAPLQVSDVPSCLFSLVSWETTNYEEQREGGTKEGAARTEGAKVVRGTPQLIDVIKLNP